MPPGVKDIGAKLAQSEAARRESDERYRSLLDSIDEGFCVFRMVFDDHGVPIDYVFLETNREFENQSGLRGAIGRSIQELVPTLQDSWFRIYGDVALTGNPVRVEGHAEGMSRWFNIYAYRVGAPEDRTVAALFTDVTERKLAELALHRSEQRLSELIQNIPAFVAILRGPNHVFEFANEPYLELLGHREIIGKPIIEAIPEIAQPFPALLRHVYETGEPYQASGMRVHIARGPGGAMEERWLDFVYSPLRGPDGTISGVTVFGVDLTERIRAEEALRQSQLAHATEIAAMNRLQELSARLLVAPTTAAVLEEVLDAVISLLGADMGTVQFYDEAGRCLRPAATRGFTPEQVALFSRIDASCPSTCGAALRRGTRFVLENAPADPEFAALEGQYGFRAAQSTPLCSRTGKLLGMLTTHFRAPHCPSDRELRILDLYIRQATDLIERFQIDDFLREGQSRHRDHLESLVAERTRDLEHSNESLRLSERMAALGTFALGVGHDLNNLLLPVRDRLETLAARAADAESTADIRAIEGALRHIHTLSRGLRVYAADADGDGFTGPTDLAAWCADAAILFRTGLPASIALRCSVESGTPHANISPGRLSQAVLNLVQNASDAIVNARGRGSPGRIDVTIAPTSDDLVKVSVRDDGPGMSDEVRRRCTEPFFTTRPRSLGGTGLGLSIVHGIAAGAGGRLDITSEIGKGTTVAILLPVTTARPPLKGAPLEDPASSAALPRALVTLSDRRAAAFATTILAARGFDLLTTSDPADTPALDTSPALWITDATPTALQAASALNSAPTVPVIIVVGGDQRWRTLGATVLPSGAGLSGLKGAIDAILMESGAAPR